jgi:hypothetical protein
VGRTGEGLLRRAGSTAGTSFRNDQGAFSSSSTPDSAKSGCLASGDGVAETAVAGDRTGLAGRLSRGLLVRVRARGSMGRVGCSLGGGLGYRVAGRICGWRLHQGT